MSNAKAINIINNTVLPKAHSYSKFRSFEDADRVISSNEQITQDVHIESEKILSVDPKSIKIWKFKDRSKTKLDLDDLIERIKDNGQLVPCIVRKIENDQNYQYELLAGRKRLMAATRIGINLKIIIKDVKNDVEALIIQNDENEREDPSDYDRGIQYQNLLDAGLLKSQSDIARLFKKERQYVSKVLQYAKIPVELENAINDFKNVSANTAEILVSLSSKGKQYLQALINISERIRNGIGSFTIKKLVEIELNAGLDKKLFFTPRKVFSDGTHFFTWKLDSNNNVSIAFPSNSSILISQKQIEELLLNSLMKASKTN